MKEIRVRIIAIEEHLGDMYEGPETVLTIGDSVVMRGRAATFDVASLTIRFVTEEGERFGIDHPYDESIYKALKTAAENREWLNMEYTTANDEKV